jgi:HD-GYP domain-containing protein (c-di-GMP phosphodiesterase class II)
MVAASREIALSEVIGGLSYALDITEGEPPGHAVRCCLIGMRLADELGLDAAARSDLFYALLLKDAGCSANSARMAALFAADDHFVKRTGKRIDWARPFPAFVWAVHVAAPGRSARARVRRLLSIRDEGQVTRSLMAARCERGAEIAYMLGLSARSAEAIRALDEHWDGNGHPRGLRGEQIPLEARILCLAQTMEIFHAAGGVNAAYRVANRRRGGWFDPALVDAARAFRRDASFWASLAQPDLSAAEPSDRVLRADAALLDRIVDAFAAVVDAKSPWTYRHSDRTSVIATSIGAELGCDTDTLRQLRRAARLHDIGKLAVSNRILDKPASLSPAEFADVKRHPVFTQRILERVPAFRDLAPLASTHHERLDGGGYPDGLTGGELTVPMRVLALADVYEALTSKRPYRPARRSDEALAIIRRDVPRRLDPDAFAALEALLRTPASAPASGLA